jgi:high-affinity nickel-transport protein
VRARRARLAAALTPAEWRRAAAFAAAVAALHVIGLALLLRAGALGAGIGVTAYALGLRHAFDADHIAAIDNTTRKLMEDGQRPLGVGFFFSLGHSTVVFVLVLALAAGTRALGGQVVDGDSWLQGAAGIAGTVVSGGFLVLIGILNLVILVSIVRVFRDMRRGSWDAARLDASLNARGGLNRVFWRVARAVRRPWHMYPIGLLFGLGFDTATEVGLLYLAAGAAFSGVPVYAILCLPILFAAGMSLVDTVDGAFMSLAYGWAFGTPVRRVFYNIAVTGLSVALALAVGTVELLSLRGRPLVDLSMVGYITAGLFVLTWAVAVAIWRLGRIEERWAAGEAVAPRRP